MRESDLYPPLMQTRLFDYETLAFEVPVADFMQSRKRIDIVLFDNQRTLTAIEVKISNWKSAIKQAFSNLFASNFSYIALWHDYVDNVERDLLRKTGIGLISVDADQCKILEHAIKSTVTIERKHYYVMTHCNLRTPINEPRIVHSPKSDSRKQLDRRVQRRFIFNFNTCAYPRVVSKGICANNC